METPYDVPYVRTVDAGVANRVYVDWKFENRLRGEKKHQNYELLSSQYLLRSRCNNVLHTVHINNARFESCCIRIVLSCSIILQRAKGGEVNNN